MGYVYEKLKKVCGGNRVASASRVITDWTPNELRCLVISRNFIFVAHHGAKPPVLIPLSEVEVAEDVKKNGSTGSLTNLLNRRQLSCMEEIYVDYIFRDYKGFFNLEYYVQELVRDGTSRLRYYGYGDFTHPNAGNLLVDIYKDALRNFNYLFTYANYKHRGKLEYLSTGIDDWYSKYNLRPQYYGLDGPRGLLSIYFKRCEDEVKKQILASKNVTIQESIVRVFDEIYRVDVKNYESVLILKTFCQYCFSNKLHLYDEVRKAVCMNVAKTVRKLDETASLVKGLSPEVVSLDLRNISQVEREVIKEYRDIGVLKVSPKEPDSMESMLQELVSIRDRGTGFLNIPTALDKICLAIHTDKHVDKLLSGVICMPIIDDIPNGDFRKVFVKSNSTADVNSLSGYLSYIFGIAGVSMQDIRKP